ncbi:MAG: hypothetical protein ACYTEQ_05670 [Planctomycetota bacterium]|jgi:hypothetical protein
MAKIRYADISMREARLAIVVQANKIISEYQAQGFTLTLRQLYYQFVARDFIANTERDYKRLGGIINDGRLAGLLDWEAIEDRTRVYRANSHWSDPASILQAAADSYAIDTRSDQAYYVEVWVEKDALSGVIEQACQPLDIPFFSCRGYVSASAMWRAAQRFLRHSRQQCCLLHLGDHDPSGIDMSRDIQDRLELFGAEVTVKRIALNLDQIERYNPPPNPAKVSDSRYEGYVSEFGTESWELDALEPQVLVALIQAHVRTLTNDLKRQRRLELQKQQRSKLQAVADRWGELEL